MFCFVFVDCFVDISHFSFDCQIELSPEEIDLVLQTLVFDGKLEEVKNSVAALTGHGGKVYKVTLSISFLISFDFISFVCCQVSSPIHPPNYYSNVPCGVCRLFDLCYDGGVISPQTCHYMTEWLAMSGGESFSPPRDNQQNNSNQRRVGWVNNNSNNHEELF